MSGEQHDVFKLIQEVQKLREALAVALDRIRRLEMADRISAVAYEKIDAVSKR